MDAVLAYRKKGYAILRSVFSPGQVAIFRGECDRLQNLPIIDKNNLRCRWNPHIESGEGLLDSLDPVIDLSPELTKAAEDVNLLASLSELLDGKVVLFKDKLLFKPPGAPGYSLHQDFIAWPGFPRSFTTALVAIDQATTENGCLEVYVGEHKEGCLSTQDGDYHDLPNVMFRNSEKIALELNEGDVAVFGCFLPHFSKPNRSIKSRRHLYFSYNVLADGGDQRVKHYEQYFSWLKKRYNEYGYTDGFFK